MVTRFRVLVPVWGDSYVERFCRISLPALVADGNLPALSRAGECEVVVLTTADSARSIVSSKALAALDEVCSVSFIVIDDLLAFNEYGVILTAAYGRGIASMGERQCTTAFIFLNADFVFSDGLLSTVLDRVRSGFRAVLAPSLRCVDDEVGRQLGREAAAMSGVLSLYPSELVRLALDHLHPTAAASIVNRTLCHSEVANQFFWQVDQKTLIGRYFLMFMLCIWPETPFQHASGWCDYSFIPELVPSRHFDIISDSDEGFILELQDVQSEATTIQAGRFAPADYARRLSYWTTAEHRRYAQSDIVFHAGEPPDLAVPAAEFGAFMSDLFGQMSAQVTSHRDHPYWVSSINRQKDLFPRGLPTEFTASNGARGGARRGSLARSLKRAMGLG